MYAGGRGHGRAIARPCPRNTCTRGYGLVWSGNRITEVEGIPTCDSPMRNRGEICRPRMLHRQQENIQDVTPNVL